MTQNVTVLSVNGHTARVIHNRPTACHGDCDHCAGGCGAMAAKEKIIVEAENLIGARPGDRVVIEGATKKVAAAIVLVYVLPLVLFFLGYFLTQYVSGPANLVAVLGFVLGLAVAVLVSRSQKKKGTEIQFRITAFARE